MLKSKCIHIYTYSHTCACECTCCKWININWFLIRLTHCEQSGNQNFQSVTTIMNKYAYSLVDVSLRTRHPCCNSLLDIGRHLTATLTDSDIWKGRGEHPCLIIFCYFVILLNCTWCVLLKYNNGTNYVIWIIIIFCWYDF